MGSNKDQGEVSTRNSPRGVFRKRKRGRSATKHKKAKRSNKISTRRISVSIDVLLHPCRQKSPLLLIKDINLKERSASIYLLHIDHHRHLLPRSLQKQEVETDCWVVDSKLYLRKVSSDTISPLTWPNMLIQILKLR